jgi:arabinofuranan 3-O-arabinosyltransferase
MATRLRAIGFGRALPWGLAALALVLAFGQRDDRTYVDTRIELTAGPSLFLDRVTSVWSSSLDLGHVQSGQFVGYLFPMGPYFAGTDALGVPAWIAERVWLAAVLWLAGWGTVLLVDALYSRRRGSVHLVAAVLYLANPYVVVQGSRATASLLAYAALPWILLAARRGLGEPRAWRWPAVLALAVAASSGGTNAATVFWIVLAPAALLLYEVLVLRASRAAAVAFAWRAAVLGALASAWWIVPAMIQGRQGAEFLSFTEQPHAIWSNSSMSESLRLMGYWLSYFESGFGNVVLPTSTAVRPYLTNELVIVATFAVPLLAFGGLLLTRRRWTYAPFFGLLAVGALLVMAAGYPAGKPAAGTLESIYYELQATQFLRTTYKAGPLLALGLACLAGAAARELLIRVPRLEGRAGVLVRAGPAVALAGLAILFAWPMFSGRLIEPAFVYGEVPGPWRSAMADAARATPEDRRILVLPGQLFGAYRWGETFEPPIAPVLTRQPVLQRTVDHYADPRAVQLQGAVDDLVQQGRLVPGQLGPLLEHMGVGEVVVAADGRPERSGESPPATIAETLRDQPGFERPAGAYGPVGLYAPLRGQGGPPVELPDLRRYDTPGERGPGAVRLHATEGAVVLDGDGNGIAGLAASGGLRPGQALFYAGDLDRRAIRDRVRSGAALVFSDTNRRHRLTPSVIRGDVGPTLSADESLPRDAPRYDLFPEQGTSAQTVVEYSGLATLRAPTAARNTLTSGRDPYAAFDGRIETTWLPPEPLPSCACLDLALRRPRSVDHVRVHPRALETGASMPLGVSVNGGPERQVSLSPLGWNRIAIGAQPLRTLRLRTIKRPLLGGLGLDEVEIPGVSVRKLLRLPTWLATATRDLDLSRNPVAVELQRATSDFPFRPSTAPDKLDAEPGITRLVTLPARRRFETIAGWASPSPDAPDSAFDRLAGMPAGWRLDGSSRFEGIPGNRASSAFDREPATAWVASFDERKRAWLSVRVPRPFTVRRMRLVRGPSEYAFPARLDVEAGGRTFLDLRPAPDGTVVLPRPVRTQALRVEVSDVDAAGAGRLLDAVALGELQIVGLRPPAPRRRGGFETGCGDLVLRSRLSSATARVSGSIEALDRGAPLRLAGCGPREALDLPAGTGLLTAEGATLRPYLLSLRSAAPSGTSAPPAVPGVVRSQGRGGDGSREDVRVRLDQPAWLVLGEGYADGWRAACRSADGKDRELGAPVPIDGFANGWRVDRSCTEARFWFAPQRLATASYVVSALAGLAILGLLGVALWRRRRAGAPLPETPAAGPLPAADTVVRLGWRAAVAVGLAVGLAGAWFFAVRAGVLLALAVAFLAWTGVSSRRLLWLAIPPLALIPLLYALDPFSGANGFFGYADAHGAAHWLAVAAVCAVAAACLLDAWEQRRATAPEAPEPVSYSRRRRTPA